MKKYKLSNSILYLLFWKSGIILCILLFSSPSYSQHNHSSEIDPDWDRWIWQMPNRVMSEIGIVKGMTVADIGAGDGYFSIRISNIVGPEGKVYASDINEELLRRLEQKADEKKLNNIEVVVGPESDPCLTGKDADIILIVNTIHLIQNFKVFVENALKGLKQNGLFIIIQWDKSKTITEFNGFQSSLSMDETLMMINNAGLRVVEIKTFLPMQNIYLCMPAAK